MISDGPRQFGARYDKSGEAAADRRDRPDDREVDGTVVGQVRIVYDHRYTGTGADKWTRLIRILPERLGTDNHDQIVVP